VNSNSLNQFFDGKRWRTSDVDVMLTCLPALGIHFCLFVFIFLFTSSFLFFFFFFFLGFRPVMLCYLNSVMLNTFMRNFESLNSIVEFPLSAIYEGFHLFRVCSFLIHLFYEMYMYVYTQVYQNNSMDISTVIELSVPVGVNSWSKFKEKLV
jgi:hypothetical protein